MNITDIQIGMHLHIQPHTERDIKKGKNMPIMQIENLIPTGPSVSQQQRWPEINTSIT